MSAAEKLRMTYAEYVRFADESPVKVEFVDGVAYAMSGGRPVDAQLGARMITALSLLVRPGRGRCEVYSSDARIHVLASGNSYYPDVSVICGPVETAPHDALSLTDPVLIAEVLSASTEMFDRGRKFADYRRIPSLVHYLLVSADEARIEHYRRNADDTWTLSVAEAGGVTALPDLGGSIAVDELFDGVVGAAGG